MFFSGPKGTPPPPVGAPLPDTQACEIVRYRIHRRAKSYGAGYDGARCPSLPDTMARDVRRYRIRWRAISTVTGYIPNAEYTGVRCRAERSESLSNNVANVWDELTARCGYA